MAEYVYDDLNILAEENRAQSRVFKEEAPVRPEMVAVRDHLEMTSLMLAGPQAITHACSHTYTRTHTCIEHAHIECGLDVVLLPYAVDYLFSKEAPLFH